MLSFCIQDTAVMCNFIVVYKNHSAKYRCFGNCEITYPPERNDDPWISALMVPEHCEADSLVMKFIPSHKTKHLFLVFAFSTTHI